MRESLAQGLEELRYVCDVSRRHAIQQPDRRRLVESRSDRLIFFDLMGAAEAMLGGSPGSLSPALVIHIVSKNIVPKLIHVLGRDLTGAIPVRATVPLPTTAVAKQMGVPMGGNI